MSEKEFNDFMNKYLKRDVKKNSELDDRLDLSELMIAKMILVSLQGALGAGDLQRDKKIVKYLYNKLNGVLNDIDKDIFDLDI